MNDDDRAELDRDPTFQAWLDRERAQVVMEDAFEPPTWYAVTAKGLAIAARFEAARARLADEPTERSA